MSTLFSSFKELFQKETGLDANEYPNEYINYVNTIQLNSISNNLAILNGTLKDLIETQKKKN